MKKSFFILWLVLYLNVTPLAAQSAFAGVQDTSTQNVSSLVSQDSLVLPVVAAVPTLSPKSSMTSINISQLVTSNIFAPTIDAAVLESKVLSFYNGRYSLEQVPFSINIITKKQIEKMIVKDLKDVLVQAGNVSLTDFWGNGVDVQLGSNGGKRGSVLLVVDGVKENYSLHNDMPWLYCPVQAIEQIEIFTPHAAYPCNYSKIVFITTNKSEAHTPFYVLQFSGGNKGQLNSAIGINSIALGKLISTSWAFERQQGAEMRRYNSAYDILKASGKTTFSIARDLTVDWVLRYAAVDQEYPGDLSEEEREANPEQATTPMAGAHNYFFSNAVSWQKNYYSGAVWSGSISTMHKNDLIIKTMRDQGWTNEEWATKQEHYSLNNSFVFTPQSYGLVSCGFDYAHKDFVLQKFKTNTAGGRRNKKSELLFPIRENAWFVQDRIGILNNCDLLVGIRNEALVVKAIEIKSSGKEQWSLGTAHNSYVCGLQYSFSEKWQFFTNAAEGTVVNPYARYQDARIKDSRYLKTEAGFKYNSSETLLSRKTVPLRNPWRAAFLIFSKNTRQELFWLNESPFAEDTLRYGVEGTISGQVLKEWNAFGQYTNQEAHFASGMFSGKELPLTPEEQYVLGATYYPTKNISITFVETYYEKQWAWNNNNNDFEHLPAYDIFDVRFDYTRKDYNLFFIARNIFDRKYSVSATYLDFPEGTYYIPGARRTWEAGIRYVF